MYTGTDQGKQADIYGGLHHVIIEGKGKVEQLPLLDLVTVERKKGPAPLLDWGLTNNF